MPVVFVGTDASYFWWKMPVASVGKHQLFSWNRGGVAVEERRRRTAMEGRRGGVAVEEPAAEEPAWKSGPLGPRYHALIERGFSPCCPVLVSKPRAIFIVKNSTSTPISSVILFTQPQSNLS
jgi:hypothetical protein